MTVSPMINDPDVMDISVNFGITSIPLVLSKKAYCLPNGLKPFASNATFLDLIWVSGSLDVFMVSINVPLNPPVILLVPPSTNTFLTQESDAGVNTIVPVKSIMLNGFTFSTLDANGCVIQSFSVYFKVTWSPVFWTFESSNSKFDLKSAVSRFIDGSSAGWGDTE